MVSEGVQSGGGSDLDLKREGEGHSSYCRYCVGHFINRWLGCATAVTLKREVKVRLEGVWRSQGGWLRALH
jgi:hypothetical protein